MNLLGIELSAIANLAVRMANADGRIDPTELEAIAVGFRYFNVSVEQAKSLIMLAAAADEQYAIAIVSQMPNEQNFVAAWLATIAAADGVIDQRERNLLRRYSELCGFPLLSPDEALQTINEERSASTPQSKKPVYDDYEEDMGPMFIANDPVNLVEQLLNWDVILGYGIRPYDVINDLEKQNKVPGPYTWDLASKVAKIVKAGSAFKDQSQRALFEKWFYDRFAYAIKREKMEGVRRDAPVKKKGFWESLFS